jgi:hypothetical protein
MTRRGLFGLVAGAIAGRRGVKSPAARWDMAIRPSETYTTGRAPTFFILSTPSIPKEIQDRVIDQMSRAIDQQRLSFQWMTRARRKGSVRFCAGGRATGRRHISTVQPTIAGCRSIHRQFRHNS